MVAWIGLLNLLTAIFIDSLTELSKEADSAKKLVIQDKRYALMKFIAESYCRFDQDNDGSLDIAEALPAPAVRGLGPRQPDPNPWHAGGRSRS